MGACHNCGETITDVVGFRAPCSKSHSYLHCYANGCFRRRGEMLRCLGRLSHRRRGRVVVHFALAPPKIRAETRPTVLLPIRTRPCRPVGDEIVRLSADGRDFSASTSVPGHGGASIPSVAP